MKYPVFEEITTKHKSIIDAITNQFFPYCDFQFSNLLSWSSDKHPTKFSIINDNLVIEMKEYDTDKIITMFMGKNKLADSINELLKEKKLIERVPEEVILELKKTKTYNDLKIEEDYTNFDNILELDRVINLVGKDLKSKRHNVRTFFRLYPDHKVEIIKATDSLKIDFENFFKQIADELNISIDSLKDELIAIEKLLTNSHLFTLPILIVKHNNKMIGFTINEILRDNPYETAIGCFGKGLREYKGIFAYLEFITAKLLQEKGLRYINIEEDLGFEGLKESKRLWRPVKILKKYIISKNS